MSLTKCKECIVYHYWNHMADYEKSFLNVVIGGFVLQALPKKFADNIKGKISEFVKLEVPDGKSYDIQIAKKHNDLVFRSGWKKIANIYELEQCDMLVFRYRGNSRFRVQIFDQSGCEKEFSCVVMNSTPSVKGSCGHRMSISSQNTICKDCAAHHYWHQMDKTCFFAVMLEEDFKSGLIIPRKFVNNVGGQISGRIKLKVRDGETYDIEVAKEHNELLLQSGWKVFASAYELEQGDTLVFGYSRDSHFEVQIFSPSTCEKELSCFPINSIPCVQETITSHDSHLRSSGSERMNKTCTPCKDCIANHYWHHMGDTDRCFIKVIISVSNFKEKLIIPKKFVNNVGGQIPEEVQPEVPNGKTYNVKVAREQDAFVMGSGWANFASACDLEHGDFLVFTYSGKSHFKVCIFDPSNCEKYFSSVVMDDTYEQDRRISNDNTPTSFHMQSPTRKRSVERGHASSSHTRKTSKKKPTDSPSQKSAEDVNIEEPLNSVVFQKSWLVFPMGCNMTSEQKRKIDALEQKIRPQIPLYITAMDMTSVNFGFLAKMGPSQFLMLMVAKTWAITLGISTVGWYALCTGWLNFVKDNKLREGNICIFEPSKSKGRVTLIFHPLEICSKKTPGYVPSSGSPMHGVTEPGYILSRFTDLNDQQKHKVKDKVRTIGSSYDLSVLIVASSNVYGKSSCMGFCSEYAKKYLQGGYDAISLLHPEKTNVWDAEIAFSSDRYRIGRGWWQFASDNELKVGDICLFQLMETKKLTMTVHIIRKHECT